VIVTILILAVSATLGAALRYYASLWAAAQFGTAFPYGTLLVNVVGSFILGAFLTLATQRIIVSPALRLFVATGFCGSLTTFSTYSYETVAMLEQGSYLTGALYLFGSLALGIVSVIAGAALIRALFLA
jgi:CrcB protein